MLRHTLNHLLKEKSCWFKKRYFFEEFMARTSSQLLKKRSSVGKS